MTDPLSPPGAPARSAPETRRRVWAGLTERPLDVLVIGGGIVGAGIARDAALRGLRVGLVEQHDFAYGTSSRSSRLLHGGLRYLAQGRLGLVHEASVEKKIIHHIAPHLAEPLPFVFPAYRDNPNWRLWQLKIGVKLYDLLCSGRNLGKSSWLDRAQVQEKLPGLLTEGLTGAVRYYDGFTQDARLVLDTLRSAARSGALVLNYCRFLAAERKPLWECGLEDRLGAGRKLVRARTLVNATGPWAEALPHSRVKLRVTKGVHLVVERRRVPVPETVVMSEGKRILFAIPWGERTILGTTDTDYQGPVEAARVEPADLRYVLEVTNHFFPAAKLTPADAVSAWAGLRPLLADRHGKPSDISRSHQIRMPEPGWWDVAGGKLTTYRLMAEQTLDWLVQWLEHSGSWDGQAADCRTAVEPLLPPSETAGVSGILPPALDRQIVEHYVRQEWAVRVEDVMVRRTSWQRYFREAPQFAEQVAEWMGDLLGWGREERTRELEGVRAAAGL